MQKLYYYRMVIGMIAVIMLMGVVLPTSTTQAAVVFSNMSGNDNLAQGARIMGVAFDVSAGTDYQINSVQIRLLDNGTINLAVHVDNAGTYGAQVIDLGAQAIPVGTNTVTFNPIGASTLPAGARYWLILTQPTFNVLWVSENPPTAPTGIFTFVDNGNFIPAFNPQPLRYKLSIDADPIAVVTLPINSSVVCNNADNRLNTICEEPWQTAAIYCRADGSIDVYGITNGEGWLAFRTTQSEIDAIGTPAQNTLIEQSDDGAFRLYRLSTGEFQVNAPMWDNLRGNLTNGYTFLFNGCP